MKQKKFPGGKTTQFTRDDAARITAEAINAVLEKLSIRQIVAGIAVLPAGEGVLLVDVVMRDLAIENTWGISVTIPRQRRKQMNTTEIDWNKQYVVFSASRLDLQHFLGFSHDEVMQLSDYDMQRIAEEVRESFSHHENDFWETVRFVTSVFLAEKSNADNRTRETEH